MNRINNIDMARRFDNILTKEELGKILRVDKVTIFKASATWCRPCKAVASYVEELFDKTSANVQLVYLDVDEGLELFNYLKLRKVPTFISFVGKEKMDIYETADRGKIEQFFQKVKLRAKVLGN